MKWNRKQWFHIILKTSEFQKSSSDSSDRLLQTNRRVHLSSQLDRTGNLLPERNRTNRSGPRVPDLRRRAEHGLQVPHSSVLHFRHRLLLQDDQDGKDVWTTGEQNTKYIFISKRRKIDCYNNIESKVCFEVGRQM